MDISGRDPSHGKNALWELDLANFLKRRRVAVAHEDPPDLSPILDSDHIQSPARRFTQKRALRARSERARSNWLSMVVRAWLPSTLMTSRQPGPCCGAKASRARRTSWPGSTVRCSIANRRACSVSLSMVGATVFLCPPRRWQTSSIRRPDSTRTPKRRCGAWLRLMASRQSDWKGSEPFSGPCREQGLQGRAVRLPPPG